MKSKLAAIMLAMYATGALAGGAVHHNGNTTGSTESSSQAQSTARATSRATSSGGEGGSATIDDHSTTIDNSTQDNSYNAKREAPALAMHSGGDCTGAGISLVGPGAGIALSQVSKECEKRRAIELLIEFEDYDMARRVLYDLQAVKDVLAKDEPKRKPIKHVRK